jgi:hypothetical protein
MTTAAAAAERAAAERFAKLRPAVETIAGVIALAIERSDRFGDRTVLLSRDEANQISEAAATLRQEAGS